MGSLIRLVKVSAIEDTAPFLIPASLIQAVQVPDTDPPGPPGVYLVEIAGRPGPHWSWDLNPADLPEGTPITYERTPR